jgi:peptide/nickel transport system permease protein
MWFLLKRGLFMLITLWCLSIALFAILSAMPGNPVDLLVMSNPHIKAEDIARLKKLRGLDKPWYVQYWRWLWGYEDPMRPPEVRPIDALLVSNDGAFKSLSVDLKGKLVDPNFVPSKEELETWLTELWPSWQSSKEVRLLKKYLKKRDVPNLFMTAAALDPNLQLTLQERLKERSAKELKLEPLFGAEINNNVLSQRFGDKAHDLWLVISNHAGQQKVLRVMSKNQESRFLNAINTQLVDENKPLMLDLKKFIVAGPKPRLRFSLREGPGHLAENGVYEASFDVEHEGTRELYAFDIEHGAIGRKDKFNNGFIFFLTGDRQALGFSRTYKRPVYDLLFGTSSNFGDGRISNTLQLMLGALLLSLLVAIPMGIYSATRQYSLIDYSINFAAFVGISLPIFWFGIMMIYVFAERLGILPPGGMSTPGIEQEGFLASFGDRFMHLILPTLVLSIFYTGRWLRYMRASMLEVLPKDYIRTAHAKGLPNQTVIYKHALRNALIPVVTVLALSIPTLFGGAVLTETVFSWPGIGRLQYEAVVNNDYYVAMVVFLIAAMLVMLGNLAADLLYIIVDPRMRKDSSA